MATARSLQVRRNLLHYVKVHSLDVYHPNILAHWSEQLEMVYKPSELPDYFSGKLPPRGFNIDIQYRGPFTFVLTATSPYVKHTTLNVAHLLHQKGLETVFDGALQELWQVVPKGRFTFAIRRYLYEYVLACLREAWPNLHTAMFNPQLRGLYPRPWAGHVFGFLGTQSSPAIAKEKQLWIRLLVETHRQTKLTRIQHRTLASVSDWAKTKVHLLEWDESSIGFVPQTLVAPLLQAPTLLRSWLLQGLAAQHHLLESEDISSHDKILVVGMHNRMIWEIRKLCKQRRHAQLLRKLECLGNLPSLSFSGKPAELIHRVYDGLVQIRGEKVPTSLAATWFLGYIHQTNRLTLADYIRNTLQYPETIQIGRAHV